jgi:hypothetical protein
MAQIAERLLKALKKHEKRKVVDLAGFRAACDEARRLDETVQRDETFAELHPAHALLVAAQNQLSVFVEIVTALSEMERFSEAIESAEEEYMPTGPPMSPLTNSFFSAWAYFDLCFGLRKETLATCLIEVGRAMGLPGRLLALWTLLQTSRLGIYEHQGTEDGLTVLSELITGERARCLVPAGYPGRRGELWLARVVPSPTPLFDGSVVMITPYLLLQPGTREWLAYFERTLPKVPAKDETRAYETLMKHGLSRHYWSEFVTEAYVNHRSEVIFLAGLPDVDASRPHSRVNRDREPVSYRVRG